MMKKMLSSICAIALLSTFAVDAKKCCDDLKGIVGTVSLDTTNTLCPTFPNPPCQLPVSLSGAAGNLFLSTAAGCGFKVVPVCLTVRQDPIALPVFQLTGESCPTGCFPQFSNLVEAILEFDVVFDKPFKNRPSITTGLEINTPFGNKCPDCPPTQCAGTDFCCPLICGGTVICDVDNIPVGYINDVVVFVSAVSTNSFRYWLDVKFALPSVVNGVLVVQQFISQGHALLHFHAIGTQNP